MFRIITLFCILISLTVLVSDAYVRVEGAEMACPDWPTCYGQLMIASDAESIAQAQQHFPDNPIKISQVCKLLTNRYTLTALVLFNFILLVLSLLQKQARRTAIFSSSILFMLSGLQLALSMWITATRAMPVIELAFVLNGLLIFWLLCWLFWRTKPGLNNTASASSALLLGAAMLIVFLHVALGTWSSVNNAVLACSEFPKCNGSWWPIANYHYALDILNGLRSGYAGHLAYSGQIGVHWLHRISSVLVFIVLTLVMFSTTASANPKPVRRSGMILSGLLLLEICLTIATIRLGAPVWILLLHPVVSAVLMLPLLFIFLYRRFAAQQDSVPLQVTDVLEGIPVRCN